MRMPSSPYASRPGISSLRPGCDLRRIRHSAWTPLAAAALLCGCAAKTPTVPTAPAAATAPEATPSAAEAPARRAKPIDPELALATFDAAWERIRDTHFDPTFNGVDWIAVREELRPRVASADDADAVRDLIREMVGRLGQSHFGVIASDEFEAVAEMAGDAAPSGGSGEPGFIGIEARFVDGEAIVVRVDPDGPATAAGVRPGMRIASIDGRDPQRLLRIAESDPDNPMLLYEANAMLAASLAAAEGEAIALELAAGEASPRSIDVSAATPPWEMSGVGNLPPMPTSLSARGLGESALRDLGLDAYPGDEIGLIAFSVWLTPFAAPFDAAIDRFRGSLGIVIDLRGNPGGLGGMVMGVGGHFFDRPASLGTMATRENEVHFRVNPRRIDGNGRLVEPLDLPVAILVDEMSASTSEIFAGGMQEAGRARVFGRTTAGAALPATVTTLPNGDVLLAAIADFTTPGGVRLEGRGVIPDEAVPLDAAGLAAGGDPDLEAACRWILDQWLPPDADPPADG